MMAGQLALAPIPRLPLRPEDLVDVDPPTRGRLYNLLDLCPRQRGCVEEARRLVLAGGYKEAIR